MTKLRLPSTTARSCRRAPRSRSAVIGGRGLIDDAFVAKVEVGELPVGVFEPRQRDRPSRPGRRAAHLSDAVFKPVWQFDAGAILGAGHRVADRLADRLDDAGNAEMAAPSLDIDLKVDGPEQRLKLRWTHRR